MRRIAVLVSLAATLAACGSTTGPTDGETPADTTTPTDTLTVDASDSASPMDVITPSDVPIGVDTRLPDAPIIPTRGGQIAASVLSFSGAGTSIGTAAFWAIRGSNPSDNCRQTIEGACTITDCRTTMGGDAGMGSDGGTSTSTPTAGVVTISGGMGAPMMLMPGMNGTYRPVNEMGVKWMAGDVLTFAGAGAEVPAFSGTLTFPTPIMVTSPRSMSILMPIPINRAMGLPVTWMPGEGSISVFIAQGGAGGTMAMTSGVVIDCAFPSSTGSATVPASVLSMLTATSGMFPDALLAITARATTEVVAGEYRITLNATGGGSIAAARIQ